MNKYNNITKVDEIVLSYDKKLSYGTIISGTYFNHNKEQYITCEDIHCYKGKRIHQQSYIKRLNLLKNIFDNEVRQVLYTNKFAVLGLPIICDNLKSAFSAIQSVPYLIKGIIFQNLEEDQSLGILLNNQEKITECIFKIKADLEQDMYNLYCKGKYHDNEFYNLALISDYKTSVMMNNLFRNIKENKNLDSLEESDEEEEFENVSEDKFVNLKKIVYMKCNYIKKFRKWKPIAPVEFGEKLPTKKEIMLLE